MLTDALLAFVKARRVHAKRRTGRRRQSQGDARLSGRPPRRIERLTASDVARIGVDEQSMRAEISERGWHSSS